MRLGVAVATVVALLVIVLVFLKVTAVRRDRRRFSEAQRVEALRHQAQAEIDRIVEMAEEGMAGVARAVGVPSPKSSTPVRKADTDRGVI